jgi:EAL domain-containing protein (putative c-di-GMP-specific phosphodiesterase class I)
MRALRFALDSFIKDGATAAGQAFGSVLAQTNAQARAFSQCVAEKKFRLVFQPIVELATGELRHFEVLSRLGEDDASPASAIRMAEELDLIHELDISVADQSMRKLMAQGNSRLKLAVNLSARSLLRPGFVQALIGKTQNFPGLGSRLIFEITESAQIEDLEKANTHIQALRGRGFPVYLDDFGAGAAALSYLRALQVDTVKIDGQYVRDIETSGRADAVVRHLVELCGELEVTTVAEMVETQAAADVLQAIGVDYAQGYFFGRPTAEPVYQKPGAGAVRRVGAVETWG